MWELIQESLAIPEDMMSNILYSIIALILIMILRVYTKKLIAKMCDEATKHFRLRKVCNAFYGLSYILLLIVIWQGSSAYMVTFLGVFTAGLTIAIKDVLVNIVSGIYILVAKPFKVGDRIEINAQAGDVIDLGVFEFTMLEVGNRILGEQSTGRILHIPNMMIFSMVVANYEKGFKYIWNESSITLSLDSDWELAKELFYHIINEHTLLYIEDAKNQIDTAGKEYLICYNNLTPIIYTEIKGNGIVLTIRYLCEPRKIRTTEHLIWEDILRVVKGREEIKIL
ncbi:MAG: mechanosensitive ion channel [Cellulosilyticaceae bacterium]